ncbi:MAG: hypothetical protein AAB883_01630 [Patescibacteria group bacterium]
MAPPRPTQSFVPVQEIRNGVVILKEDGYRGILMCSSTNFSLKSETEQRGIIGGFQTFVNTLDFSVEIIVHSRKMDIRPYLALLETRMEGQQTELMRLQLREYINFIRNFMDTTDIMTKLFYVVVPYTPAIASEVTNSLNFLKNVGPQKQTAAPVGTSDNFDEHRIQLEQRMSLVVGGLGSAGIRAVPLGTEEIIELLYRSFNPSETESPIKLTN